MIRRHPVIATDELLGPYPDDTSRLFFFESSSWLLFHYLVNQRAAALDRLQERLVAFQPAEVAWSAELPDLRGDQLHDQLERYASSGQYTIVSGNMQPWAGAVATRELSDAEVHGVRAYLYHCVHEPGETEDTARVAAEIAEALRLEPTQLDALAMAFYEPALAGGIPRAELARRATAAHPSAWLAWALQFDSVPAGSAEELAAMERARALSPDEPLVLIRVALRRAMEKRWDEVLELSGRALRLRSHLLTPWTLQIEALVHLDRCADAASRVRTLEGYSAPSEANELAATWRRLGRACTGAARVPEPRQMMQ